MLSRKKPAVGPGSGNTVSSAKDSKRKRKLPKLEDFLQMRDYTGASTLLEVMSVVILVLQVKFINCAVTCITWPKGRVVGILYRGVLINN